MSHSHETIGPVKGATHQRTRRKPMKLASQEMLQHTDVTSLRHPGQGMKGSERITDWVKLKDVIMSQKRNKTFPTDQRHHQVIPHSAWQNKTKFQNKS